MAKMTSKLIDGTFPDYARWVTWGVQCPLWVISGHSDMDPAMSALPPKADMLSVGIDVC
jgi:hypothetical protein